jgi:nitrogenase subunit NifH
MSDTERVIGALTEFKKATETRLAGIEKEQKETRKDIANLNTFKVKMSAYLVVAVFVIEVIAKGIIEVLAKAKLG